MIETALAKSIVLIIMGLCLIWIVYIVLKKEYDSLIRTLIVTLIFGGIFLFLQQTRLDKISFSAVKKELFPAKLKDLVYEVQEGTIDNLPYTRYVFLEGKGRKLTLTMEAGKQYFHLNDPYEVNAILSFLKLPPVSHGVRELSAITGKKLDSNFYRWDDYKLGTLIVERTLCQDRNGLTTYHCIITLTVRRK